MKVIQTSIVFDEKGIPQVFLLEEIPEDTIYTESIDGQYICYQKGDKLPKSAKAVKNMFTIKNKS